MKRKITRYKKYCRHKWWRETVMKRKVKEKKQEAIKIEVEEKEGEKKTSMEKEVKKER